MFSLRCQVINMLSFANYLVPIATVVSAYLVLSIGSLTVRETTNKGSNFAIG